MSLDLEEGTLPTEPEKPVPPPPARKHVNSAFKLRNLSRNYGKNQNVEEIQEELSKDVGRRTGARPKTGTKRTRNNDLDESQILPTRTRSRNNSQLPRQIESAKETVTTPANSDLSHNDSSLHPLGLQTTSEAAASSWSYRWITV